MKTKGDKTDNGPFDLAVAAFRQALKSVAFFSLFVNILMLTGPFFMLQVYDRVLTSHSLPTLVALCVLVVALYLFMALLDIIRNRILTRTAVRLDDSLSPRMIESIMLHAVRRTPNIGTTPARDLDAVRQFVSGPALLALFDAPWVPVYLGVIFLFHPVLGWTALAGALFLFILMLANERLTRAPMAELSGQQTASHNMTEDLYRNADWISALGMSGTLRRRWMAVHDKTLTDTQTATDRNTTITAITKASRLVLQSAILAVGAYLVLAQEILPGVMITASIIFSRALAPVEQSISQWRNVLGARKAWDRLKTLFALTSLPPEPLELPEPKGAIAADGVIVIAEGQDTPLLQNITFKVDPGEALAILGPTGAGKSTLAQILVGNLLPRKGRMTIDGATLDQWDRDRIGQHIGYLPQDAAVLSGTVAENIARFEVDADPNTVIAAAKMAELHETILALPQGYDTRVGREGIPLSGGQRQRIGLARALYRTPALVVLDEPNANLDAVGEEAVIAAIRRLKDAGSSVVVIAHRPSILQVVDKVLYLRDGRQMAFGPRDEVLNKILAKRPDISPVPPSQSAA